ncbi:hypothetical protein H9Y04_39970 [Streptomyces sp. TRM66268-LWL]|uniref:Uncharacterized protein n=1 Tax=Streptomyces polyasparticus TaxID=2767826 RepID=A0ABR7SVT4_9ACTN|nr:hypothetical protein [Streptomyces polyasparticus]MBC9718722.1 hypothetical protein [Streptomyces polyasparticus]
MGDWFQTIVDTEATPQEAQGLATSVLDWLIADGFVSAERTDCVLGADAGHAPGPRYGEAVEELDPHLINLWSNGLHVTVERTVFDAGQGEPSAVTCPHCAAELPLVDQYWSPIDENWDRFSDAVNSWPDGDDEPVACPSCDRTAPVHTWIWADDCFAFGHLGLTFWNWPALRREFVADIARRLGGHRTVLLAGKL